MNSTGGIKHPTTQNILLGGGQKSTPLEEASCFCPSAAVFQGAGSLNNPNELQMNKDYG